MQCNETRQHQQQQPQYNNVVVREKQSNNCNYKQSHGRSAGASSRLSSSIIIISQTKLKTTHRTGTVTYPVLQLGLSEIKNNRDVSVFFCWVRTVQVTIITVQYGPNCTSK